MHYGDLMEENTREVFHIMMIDRNVQEPPASAADLAQVRAERDEARHEGNEAPERADAAEPEREAAEQPAGGVAAQVGLAADQQHRRGRTVVPELGRPLCHHVGRRRRAAGGACATTAVGCRRRSTRW